MKYEVLVVAAGAIREGGIGPRVTEQVLKPEKLVSEQHLRQDGRVDILKSFTHGSLPKTGSGLSQSHFPTGEMTELTTLFRTSPGTAVLHSGESP
jgi:hypothetical protein